MNRILTIEIEITDKDKADWIWDSHVHRKSKYGVQVLGIFEGPMPEEAEE